MRSYVWMKMSWTISILLQELEIQTSHQLQLYVVWLFLKANKKGISPLKIPDFISHNRSTAIQKPSVLYCLDQHYHHPFPSTFSGHYSAFLFSTAFSRPSRQLSRWSTEEAFSESVVSRVKRTHPSTSPPSRTAVVSAVAVLSVTISPKSQSAKTVFTNQNTRLTTQISRRRMMVSTQ